MRYNTLEPMTRADELRNDLDNLYFNCRYYIGVLAELEQLGKAWTADFKRIQENVRVLKANIRRLSEELEKEEARELENAFSTSF